MEAGSWGWLTNYTSNLAQSLIDVMIFLTVNYYLVKKKNYNYSVKKKMEYFRFLTLPFSFIFTHAELSVLRGLIWPPNGHGHPTLFKKKTRWVCVIWDLQHCWTRWGQSANRGGGNLVIRGTNVIQWSCFKILQWINSRSNCSKSINQSRPLLITGTCSHLSSVSMPSLFYLFKVLQVLISGFPRRAILS